MVLRECEVEMDLEALLLAGIFMWGVVFAPVFIIKGCEKKDTICSHYTTTRVEYQQCLAGDFKDE